MGVGGIADLVDRFNGGIDCGIEADGKVGSGDVLIDGARQADTGDIEFGAQLMGAAKGAVTADDDEAIDTELFQVGVCLFAAFMFEEFLAAGGLEDGAAALDDIGHASGVHGDDIVLDHSAITAHDAKYLHSIIYSGTNNGTDGGIHSRSIAAGSEYANFSDFVFHLIVQKISILLRSGR